MVNLQAAFLGKIVVATNTTGSVEVLRGYDNLFVVRPYSVEDIQASLKKILSTDKKMAKRFFNSDQFSWMNVAKKMLVYMKY